MKRRFKALALVFAAAVPAAASAATVSSVQTGPGTSFTGPTIVAWFTILFTGNYPASLYDFAVGVLRWNVRVEAYLLLLRDEYPPFTLS